MITQHPIHALAASRGITRSGAGSHCALCGYHSPYAAAKRVKDLTAPDILASLRATSDTICAACDYVIGGKPGRTPAPLRMRSFILYPAGDIRLLLQPDWWQVLQAPKPCIASWAVSGKKHHYLYADWSTETHWRIGTDDGAAEWEHDRRLLDAVDVLRQHGAAKAAILSGAYPPQLRQRIGAVIDESEQHIAPYRGQLSLDLVVHASRTYEKDAQLKEVAESMISTHERMAVSLLSDIAWGSEMRANDGKVFWGGFYLARISRYSRLPMGEMVSRLFDDCAVGATFASGVSETVVSMSQEDEDGILAACRERSSHLHALALGQMKTYREGNRNQEALI